MSERILKTRIKPMSASPGRRVTVTRKTTPVVFPIEEEVDEREASLNGGLTAALFLSLNFVVWGLTLQFLWLPFIRRLSHLSVLELIRALGM